MVAIVKGIGIEARCAPGEAVKQQGAQRADNCSARYSLTEFSSF